MKILINCSTLKKGGGLQVAHSFVSILLQRSDHDYYFILSSGLQEEFIKNHNLDNNHFYTYDVKPSIYLSLYGKEKQLNNLLTRINPDVVFSVFGPTYWKPKALHLCGFAKAGYFYPDSPFIKEMPLFRKMKLFFLKQLHMNDFKNFNQALVTEANDAAQRLSGLLPSKKIFTVSNTYNQVFDQQDNWDKSIQLPEYEGITLLSITANYRHKNLKIITRVIAYLKEKYPLLEFRFVLTINRSDYGIIEEEHERHMLFLGRVSLYQCPFLYKQSDMMFMPTLLECFSATYPESMKMDVPILTSDLPFARDVCGDAAIYFDPMSPQSIGEAIFSLSNDQSLYTELIEKGRKRLLTYETFESRTQKYIEILETLYETNHSKS